MKTLLLAVEDRVATVTLNRPEAKNAIDATMADELADLLASLRADEAVAAIVLTGAGDAFCAGGDVKAMGGAPRTLADRRATMARYARVCTELQAMDKPVVAAVDGVAFGAGFSLALFADLVITSDRARFCMVFQRVGLMPDMGALYALPRAVGVQRARELFLTAREVGAAEAVTLGLALECVPADRLQARAAEVAQALANASPTAVRIVKRTLQATLGLDLAAVLDIETTGQPEAADSAYAKEAVRRFGAREAPQFRWPSTH